MTKSRVFDIIYAEYRDGETMIFTYYKAFKYAKKLIANKGVIKIGKLTIGSTKKTTKISKRFNFSKKIDRAVVAQKVKTFIENNREKVDFAGKATMVGSVPYALYQIFDYKRDFNEMEQELLSRNSEIISNYGYDYAVSQIGGEVYNAMGGFIDAPLVLGATALIATGIGLRVLSKTQFHK